MNLLIPPAMNLIVPLLFFYKDGFVIKESMKNDMPSNKQTEPVWASSMAINTISNIFFSLFNSLNLNAKNPTIPPHYWKIAVPLGCKG